VGNSCENIPVRLARLLPLVTAVPFPLALAAPPAQAPSGSGRARLAGGAAAMKLEVGAPCQGAK
jgi:hypothetical protein